MPATSSRRPAATGAPGSRRARLTERENRSVQFLGAEATRERLPFAALVAALRAMFEEGCELPPRQVLELAPAAGDGVTSLVMPAWQRGGCLGVKVVNVAPGNAARGLPGLHSTYVLYDATTGVPLAWLDGDEITARRTAA